MAIETPPYAPLGITTGTRWGAARWRRVAIVCALCALVPAGVLVTERAYRLWTAKPAARPSFGEAVGPAGVPIEALPEPKATEPVVAPMSPNRSAVTEAATVPAAAPEPPSPPTVLRGAGIKPR